MNNYSSEALSQQYVNNVVLEELLRFIKDQVWLFKNESFEKIVSKLFTSQVSTFFTYKSYILSAKDRNLNLLQKELKQNNIKLISLIATQNQQFKKSFLTSTLKKMIPLFKEEELTKANNNYILNYYRSFDQLDDILGIDYELDKKMIKDQSQTERLYQGSGVNVQSGFSTILLALENLDVTKNTLLLDLGSGYGRVGFVTSLLYPEVSFKGYEFVGHRVTNSNAISKSFNLNPNLEFYEQNLADQSFEIPEADVFYFYDPFTDETYKYLVKQIINISKKKKVSIITKGNARFWIEEIASQYEWPKPKYLDHNNLVIFNSK